MLQSLSWDLSASVDSLAAVHEKRSGFTYDEIQSFP